MLAIGGGGWMERLGMKLGYCFLGVLGLVGEFCVVFY